MNIIAYVVIVFLFSKQKKIEKMRSCYVQKMIYEKFAYESEICVCKFNVLACNVRS